MLFHVNNKETISELGRYINRAFVTPLYISDTLEASPIKIQQGFDDEIAYAPEEVRQHQGSLSHKSDRGDCCQ